MRKIISLVLVLILCISTIPANAQDNSNEDMVIYQTTEITDINVIDERINKGITDFDGEINVDANLKEQVQRKSRQNKNDEKELKIKSKASTIQKIKSTIHKDGTIEDEYIMYTRVELDTVTKKVSTRAGSGSGNEDWTSGDAVTGIILYLSTAFSYTTGFVVDNIPGSLFRFTSVKAKATRYDSVITMSNLIVRNNKMGPLYPSNQIVNMLSTKTDLNEYKISVPASGTFYSCADKNTYVYLCLLGSAAAYAEVTAKRGTTIWTLTASINKETI